MRQSASSTGPSISVSGVRNSWLTLREEGRLRPVEFGQRLGPPPLLLVGAGVGERRRDLVGDQHEEVLVAVVERQARTQTRDEKTVRQRESWAGDGQYQRTRDGLGPRGTDHRSEPRADVLDEDGRARVTHPGERPRCLAADGDGRGRHGRGRRGCEHRGAAVGFQPVQQREGQVGAARVQRLGRVPPGAGCVLRLRAAGRELPQRPQSTFREHTRRRFGARDEHGSHIPGFSPDRTVGVQEVALLEIAVAVERHQHVVEADRAAVHHLVEERSDDVPGLGERVPGALADRGMLGLAQDRPEGVVVELHEVRPPAQEHRELRLQQHAERSAKALRPARHGTEGRGRPVETARERAHRASAREHARTVDHGQILQQRIRVITCARNSGFSPSTQPRNRTRPSRRRSLVTRPRLPGVTGPRVS